jgi:ABC-2 type transport system ATP-binding protein
MAVERCRALGAAERHRVELTIRGLSLAYGSLTALQDVNLHLKAGIIAVLGPNGSGKTTLLRCLATALQPDRGELRFCGLRYSSDFSTKRILRQGLGYLPQEIELPGHMAPLLLLRYLARLKGAAEDSQAETLLAQVGLTDQAHKRLDTLSVGQARMVGVCQAFLGKPRLVILDEATRGLDLQERLAVFRLVRRVLRTQGMVIFSTHVPQDVEQVADQVIVLNAGQVLYAGAVESLHRKMAEDSAETAYLRLLEAAR